MTRRVTDHMAIHSDTRIGAIVAQRCQGIRFDINHMEEMISEIQVYDHGYSHRVKGYRKGHERCRYCILERILQKLVHEHRKKYTK